MVEACPRPLSMETLVDYLAGELDGAAEAELEEHLFSCLSCAAEADALGRLAAAIHEVILPVLAPSRFEVLEREGRVGAVNVMAPGERADVFYPPEAALLVHRLQGADLSGARRVDVGMLDLSGRELLRLHRVPFDADRGEVLIACQRHFADTFPPHVVFAIEIVEGSRREEIARYEILHRPSMDSNDHAHE